MTTTTSDPITAELEDRFAILELIGRLALTIDGRDWDALGQLFTEDSERKLMIAHLRYGDTFVKGDGAWLFAERNLYVDWIETKPSHP